jgi:hypothetical protein
MNVFQIMAAISKIKKTKRAKLDPLSDDYLYLTLDNDDYLVIATDEYLVV